MGGFLYSLVNMSIAGAFTSMVIMLLRFPLRKAPRKYSYMLWSILGIRLLCPFSFSSALSLFNLFRTETDGGRMSFDAAQNIAAPAAVPAAPSAAHSLSQAAEQTQTADFLPFILFAVWAAGAAALSVYNLVALARLKKCISGAVNIGGNIYECAAISNAFVIGIFRPKIYVPSALSDKERSFIISHERTHISRLDCVIKPIALIALCVHWFNPLMWLSFFLMVRDMEISCDERAVRGLDAEARRDYASALLNISLRQNRITSGGILAFGESSIKQRIKNVLSPRKPTLWITAAAASVIIIAAVCLLTNSDNSKPKPENTPQTVSPDNAAIQTADEIQTAEPRKPDNSEPESKPASEAVSAAIPEPGAAPELTPKNAQAAVHELLSTFVLTNADGDIDAVFTMPEKIPADPEGRTKLTISLSAEYSLGGGTFENKRFFDWETGLENGKTYRVALGSQLSSEKALQSVMLRAAFMTEVEENAYREYYADYISMSEPFEFDAEPNAAAKVIISNSGSEYTLDYRLAYDSFAVKLNLPEGMTAEIIKPGDFESFSPGSYSISLIRDGAEAGRVEVLGFGTADKEALGSVDPASDKIPMQIYSPVALSNMIDYHSSYKVIKSGGTGSAAVCFPVSNDEVISKCVMMFDYEVTPYFIMISLSPESISDDDLIKIAESVSFIQ